jgi:alkanesulfonate monooxygenase
MAARIFSTCPQSKDVVRDAYLRQVADVARWSEDAGCEGILVYTDNSIVDPWLVTQVVIESTERLCPLVAVQPVYMHPYSVAKMVTSLAYLHDRRIYLNMLAGGFRNDLLALGDDTPHDERYDRTTAYTQIILDLLRGDAPVTRNNGYYEVTGLRLTPRCRPSCSPACSSRARRPPGWPPPAASAPPR